MQTQFRFKLLPSFWPHIFDLIEYTYWIFIRWSWGLPQRGFLSIWFLYIFVKLNITVHQFEINSIIIMNCFSFLSSSFSLAIFKSLKLSYYVLLYRVTRCKLANNCCADNRNNTLIKKQSIKQQMLLALSATYQLW